MTVLGHRRRWLYRKPHGHALVDAGERVVGFMRVEPRPSLRFAIGFCLAAASMLPLGFAQADPTDDSLRIYAVDIGRTRHNRGTRARRISRKRPGHHRCPRRRPDTQTKPSVRIAGMDLPAHAIKEGSFERVDLTLLSIDERKLPIYLQMRRMSLCDNQPWPGEPVIVAIPEGTARSHVMLPALLPANVQKRFSTVIRDVATTGNSGSGVFDAGQKCLLGIMSRKITVRPNTPDEKDIAKYFVPASAIRAFIPTEYRF